MKKFIPILIFLLIISIVSADNTVYTCLDTNTSQINITIYNATSNTILLALSENTTCRFNCNTFSGECNPNPYSVSNTNFLYFIFPFISFIFLYFANNLKMEDWPIHIILIGAALLFILIPLGTLSEALPASVTWLYYLSIIIFFIVMIYYALRLIIMSTKSIGEGAK